MKKIFIILITSFLFSQDTTYISLPSAYANQFYFNSDIEVNHNCNGCWCPVGEPMFETHIISYPEWLDTTYISFNSDTSDYNYYYYSGLYELIVSGTPTIQDIDNDFIILHEYISYDLWEGYYENATWNFTDVYIIDIEVTEENFEIGDSCFTATGEIGFYDCEMCCWPIEPNWLGDGWCDYLGGCGWEGPLYNCIELAYDCGDCNDDWNGYDPANLCTNLLLGDFNNDDNIDVLDIVILVNHILSPATVVLDGSDINEDGNVDVLDIVQLINIILN